ncbi:Uncharacterised protein [Vibrio cholerae]|nr:Uncharacterised protein [Vibrio cholerae]CSC98617.1 Uncharacterised protein [Vibrio cholerae]CSD80853.1 Uncharacterised protein [Vibrio cholerae]CSI81571.1 Uncharacterised protein [Vibrio cholerae]
MCEIRFNKLLKTRNHFVINTIVKELKIVTTLCQYGFEHVLQHVFRQLCYSVQVSECNFRFNHPEFRQVTAGV